MVAPSMAARIAVHSATRVTADLINAATSDPAHGTARRHPPPLPAPRRRPAMQHNPAPASAVPMAVGEGIGIVTGAVAVVSAHAMGHRRHRLKPAATVRPLKASAVKADRIAGPIAALIATRIAVATIVTGVTAVADPRAATAGATTAVPTAKIARTP